MDLRRTVEEIGFFETARNLAAVMDSPQVYSRAGAAMPLPCGEAPGAAREAALWLTAFGKGKYLFLTPELAVVRELAELEGPEEVILLLPSGMEPEMRRRIADNLPGGVEVSLLEEPYFPGGFTPGNGLMVACGYLAGERPMVLEKTYRLLGHYGGFWGRRVFLPYTRLADGDRYPGWLEADGDLVGTVWRRA